MIDSKPRFLQGVFGFHGTGYEAPVLIDPTLAYTVPSDKRAQMIYLRAGNSAASMVVVSLLQDGRAVRLFPVGGNGGIHVPLAVVEDLEPETEVAVFIAAPAGVAGTVVIDLGMIEI
jgi:hypothetical protein